MKTKSLSLTSQKKGQLSQKMGQTYLGLGQALVLVEYFFSHPLTRLSVRELSVKLKMSKSTVQRGCQNLSKIGLLSPEYTWLDSAYSRRIKSYHFILKMEKSGLFDYLEQELGASVIVIFGSVAKGEYDAQSDVDVFVECARNRKLDLSSYEKQIGLHIELFTAVSFQSVAQNLVPAIVNGVKVRGYLSLS